MSADFRQIAWDGMRFEAPSSWEVVRIGRRHLVLRGPADSLMEIKWNPVQGKFSHHTHLRRLASIAPRKMTETIGPWSLSTAWRRALAEFESSGFTWRDRGGTARGAILFCPACRQATLVQFFRPQDPAADPEILRVLSGLRDHVRNNRVPWSVFDIRVQVPVDFQLRDFRFEAGYYRLEFARRWQKLVLYRWAPANALLAGGGLAQFAGRQKEFPPGGFVETTIGTYPAVESWVSPRNEIFRRLGRLSTRPAYRRYRLWLRADKNRILGLRVEGRSPHDPQLFDEVCSTYDCV